MTDGFRFDLPPRAEFAERLESDLLRAIGEPVVPTHRAISARINAAHDNEEHVMLIEEDTNVVTPRSRRPMTMIAAAAAAILLIAGFVWAVARNDEAAASTHDVTFTVTWAYSDIKNDCPSDTSAPMCVSRFDTPATAKFAGDIDGGGYQSVLWNFPLDEQDRVVDHLEHVASYNVGANVAGCGTGEFLLVEMIQFVSGPDRDRPSGTYTGTWQIVPQSGRNGLESIAGSGTSSGLFGTAQDVGRTLTGKVTCTQESASPPLATAPLGLTPVPTDRQQIVATPGGLPDGTYRVEFSVADLDRIQPGEHHKASDAGSLEVHLQGGTFTVQGFLQSGAKDESGFTSGVYQVTGNEVIWVLPQEAQLAGTDGINLVTWSFKNGTLTLTQMDGKLVDPWFAFPWVKIA